MKGLGRISHVEVRLVRVPGEPARGDAIQQFDAQPKPTPVCPSPSVIHTSGSSSAVLKNPLRLQNGYAIPSDSPGHGIEFDDEALAALEVQL